MSLRPLRINFVSSSPYSRRNAICFFIILALTLIVALNFFNVRQTVLVRRSEIQRQQVSSAATSAIPPRSADEIKSLQQEVNAVNRQIYQLNQHWGKLLNDLRVFPGGKVDALSFEVNAITGGIRYLATAENIETMADYAAYLADKKSLQSVVISRHEIDAQGLRFILDAKWVQKP